MVVRCPWCLGAAITERGTQSLVANCFHLTRGRKLTFETSDKHALWKFKFRHTYTVYFCITLFLQAFDFFPTTIWFFAVSSGSRNTRSYPVINVILSKQSITIFTNLLTGTTCTLYAMDTICTQLKLSFSRKTMPAFWTSQNFLY